MNYSFIIRCEGLLDSQLWNGECYFLVSLLVIQLSRERQLFGFQIGKLQAIVLNIYRVHLRQQDITGDTAIVPPVENQGRHMCCPAFIIHLYNDDIITILQQVCDVEVERSETTLMMTS